MKYILLLLLCMPAFANFNHYYLSGAVAGPFQANTISNLALSSLAPCSNGQVVGTTGGVQTCVAGSSGSGTVTSVGVVTDSSTSSIFANTANAITGSPVTTSGNMTLSLSTQVKNKVLAGPTTGSDAAPTMRLLVGADLPVPGAAALGGVFSKAAVSHNFLTSISAVDGSIGQAQPAFSDVSGTASAAQGGTGQDFSGSTGLVKVASGTMSAATLVNADVSASAGIAFSKMESVSSGNILVGNGSAAVSVAMSSEATIASGGAVTLSNAGVIGKVLTGYSSGAGTVAATDTILQAVQKLNGNTALRALGPGSATANSIVTWNGTGGVNQNSVANALLDSTANVSFGTSAFPASLQASNTHAFFGDAAIFSNVGGGGEMDFGYNFYVSGGVFKSRVTGVASKLSFNPTGNTTYYQTAPSVSAGSTQTYTNQGGWDLFGPIVNMGLTNNYAHIGAVASTSGGPVGNVTTAETTLISYTIPANVISSTRNQHMVLECWGTYAANANTKQLIAYLGATSLLDTTALVLNAGSWYLKASIMSNGSSAQTASVLLNTSNAVLPVSVSTTTPAVNNASTMVFKVTGTGISTNDIVLQGGFYHFFPQQ